MPEAATSFQRYERLLEESALQALARLPDETKLRVFRLIDEFAEDPDRFQERVETVSGGANLRYRHPDPPLAIVYRIDQERKLITFMEFIALTAVGSLVVISYSHKDKTYRDQLRVALAPLVRNNTIRVWDDKAIEAGERWRDEIAKFFDSASAAILLLSPDFLASDFIMKQELPRLRQMAEKRGMALLWIATRPSGYKLEPTLEKLQALNDPSRPLSKLSKPEREEELVVIVDKIADMVTKVP